jgi:hypothetical protein
MEILRTRIDYSAKSKVSPGGFCKKQRILEPLSVSER